MGMGAQAMGAQQPWQQMQQPWQQQGQQQPQAGQPAADSPQPPPRGGMPFSNLSGLSGIGGGGVAGVIGGGLANGMPQSKGNSATAAGWY
jgi:hypothetical protein